MLQLTSSDIHQSGVNTIFVPVCEDADLFQDPVVLKLISTAKKHREFTGKKDQVLMLYDPIDTGPERVIFSGIGTLNEMHPEIIRKAAGKAVKECIRKHLTDILMMVPDAPCIPIDIPLLLEALLEGAYLGNHRFDRYKSRKEYQPLDLIRFAVTPEIADRCRNLPQQVETICRGTVQAREWVSMPPNLKRPEDFAKAIVESARQKKIVCSLWDESALRRDGFGGILAVSAGSQSPPQMVLLDYHPESAIKTLVLVGKGVTFDAGGINLKPATSLEDMKTDMAGAAAVAATVIAAADLGYPFRLIGVIPLVENMPSGKASRPGDIIRTYDGKTVEIGNTDAEGRLILADALAHAVKAYTPDILIDVATLTGACVVALGEKIAGVFSFDDRLSDILVRSGEKVHERCWKMPLPDDYKELLKSEFADISNMSSSKWGGAITAALFLSEFVGQTRWAHIDIAGPVYTKKETAYCSAGGTGFGVRLLCDMLGRLSLE